MTVNFTNSYMKFGRNWVIQIECPQQQTDRRWSFFGSHLYYCSLDKTEEFPSACDVKQGDVLSHLLLKYLLMVL